MPTREEKRASIIAQQAAREKADQAAGKATPPPKPRSNWAASPSPARRGRGRPPKAR
jgi:hypothetical protein